MSWPVIFKIRNNYSFLSLRCNSIAGFEVLESDLTLTNGIWHLYFKEFHFLSPFCTSTTDGETQTLESLFFLFIF